MSALVLCFDRAEQRQHQDRVDASDRRTVAEDIAAGRITAELMLLMLAGMNDPKHAKAVPHVMYPVHGRGKVATQPMPEAISDMLDYDSVFALLQTALAESQCPHVATLKVAIARRLAEERAADLAQLECDE